MRDFIDAINRVMYYEVAIGEYAKPKQRQFFKTIANNGAQCDGG